MNDLQRRKPLRIINSVAPIRICDNGGWTDTWFAGWGKIFNIGVYPYAEVQLEVYHVEAITGGTDAVVNVEVRLRQGDRVITSKGVNVDIVMASIDAYIRGVNLYSSMENKKN